MIDKFNFLFEKMEDDDSKCPEEKIKTYEGTIDSISEEYVKDTTKYIDGLLKDAEGETKKFLNGLKDFLKKNGFLTKDQRAGLANITRQ